MEKENRVSVWIGKFKSKENLTDYLLEQYNEEGDSTSSFMQEFKIDYIDNQFQESFFFGGLESGEQILKDFSYIDTFKNEINELDWKYYDSLIILYDYEYNKEVISNHRLKFVNSCSYWKNNHEYLKVILREREDFWSVTYSNYSREEKVKWWCGSIHHGMRTMGESFGDEYAEFSKKWYESAKKLEPDFDSVFKEAARQLHQFDWIEYFDRITKEQFFKEDNT